MFSYNLEKYALARFLLVPEGCRVSRPHIHLERSTTACSAVTSSDHFQGSAGADSEQHARSPLACVAELRRGNESKHTKDERRSRV